MSKKKNRRNLKKYPALEQRYNLKLRQDYMDNIDYLDGVEYKGRMVIPPLSEEAKQYLNDFNEEYYNASFESKFDYDNIHKCEIDNETVQDIKAQIREIKLLRKRIFGKSAKKTTEEDREQARMYTEQIEAMEKFIDTMHPRRTAERANNRRNDDIINISKATGHIESWEIMREKEQKGLNPELIVFLKEELDEEE